MNKFLLIGVVLLLAGITAYNLIDIDKHGFWIGALMGTGGVLLLTGIFKKFS